MKHARFISECLSTPWAMMPERMAAYAKILVAKEFNIEAIKAGPARQATTQRAGGIAVIPVYGPVVQRASQMDICEGGASCQQISNALADANADDSVAQILLDIDSPGGSVYGVQELAAEIQASKKPVVALANSLAASAAYWIGAAASEFHVTPGGEVGSIGVWMAHEDWSKAVADAGVNVTLISAGDYKVEGNPYSPLGDEAKAFMQSRVDDYYQAFTKGVAKGRNVSVADVRGNMGKGRCYGADQAMSVNMVDGISTFDQVIARMSKNIQSSKPNRAARAKRDIEIIELS